MKEIYQYWQKFNAWVVEANPNYTDNDFSFENFMEWYENQHKEENPSPRGIYKGGWLTIEEESSIHVLPETDIKPHGIVKGKETSVEVADMNCPCKPRVDFRGTKPIIVHNSFETESFLDNLIK